MSSHNQPYYDFYKSVGRCPGCRAKVTDGKVYCPECRAKRNTNRRKWYAEISEERRQEIRNQIREWRRKQKEVKV